eukprot:evm.model.scf_890.1 EVM.evm.TU.scf_890.1   scf_890:1438-2277(-)
MISDGIVKDVNQALELGNRMMASDLIRHVTDGHKFENQPLFYRFTEAVLDQCDSTSDSVPAKLMGIGEELLRTEQHVAELHSQLKLHRQLNIALFESGSEQQQRLEYIIESQSVEISKLESIVVLQTFVLALTTLGMLGWFAVPVGYLLIGMAMYLSYK